MKILALGDSFTYGEELDNPKEQGWVYIVARRLGAEIKNSARPGCSNDYIIKRLMREIIKLQEKPDLIIIGWTSCSRIEEADSELGAWCTWPARTLYGNNRNSFREERVKYRTLHNNENWEFRRWVRQVVLVQDFCKARGLDYRFVNTFGNQNCAKKAGFLLKWMDQEINHSKFYGWKEYEGMMEWCWDHDKLEPIDKCPAGHPGPQSNEMIAQKFLDYYNNRIS